MLLQPHAKLLFIGDSITDAGRPRDGGSSSWDSGTDLGSGYVNLVHAELTASHPDQGVQILNTGISGNTVVHLEERWDRDVIAHAPEWLSIMIGINDVWRQFDQPQNKESHVSPDRYEAKLRVLIGNVRESLDGLVMMTPYFFERDLDHPMRKLMDEYGSIVKKIAADHDAILVDTQVAIDNVTRYIEPTTLAADLIHPGTAGHMILAKAFLTAIES